MLLIRRLEERLLALRAEGLIAGSVHPCIGQEAVPVALAPLLRKRDQVIATYRGHGWATVMGVPLVSLIAEVLGRQGGVNGGRAGSALLSDPVRGFIGQNGIVGAGLPIANGVAMALNFEGTGGVSVVSFGDGATNEGAAHEAIVFAVARNLPVLFVCENNYWSEMTPIADTVPTDLHVRAAAYGLESQVVDGSAVGAVRDVARRALAHVRERRGPSFLEVRVPRLGGHYSGDVEHYRSQQDKDFHSTLDPVARLKAELVVSKALLPADVSALEESVDKELSDALANALSSPPATHSPAPTFADQILAPNALRQTGPRYTLREAINLALRQELTERPNVIVFGEDVAVPGGTFGVTKGLRRMHGDRVFDTPIAETAILGAALGASICGMRPIVEIMWSDFLLVGLDQLVNQAANVRYVSAGAQSAPFVVRTQQGATPGSSAQHSQSLEGLVTHIPGLKVGLPSTPSDAFHMLRAAVADPDPVIIIESRAQYALDGYVDTNAPPERVGGARLVRQGTDVLLVSWGSMMTQTLLAADQLAASGIDAGVLDLRWLVPLDQEALVDAAESHNRRVLVAHEANLRGGYGAEVIAVLVEAGVLVPGGCVGRVGWPDTRVPAAPSLQEQLMPTASAIAQSATQLLCNPVAPPGDRSPGTQHKACRNVSL